MTNHLHSPPMQLHLVTCASVVSSDTPVAVWFFQRKNQPRHSGISPVLRRITGKSPFEVPMFLSHSALPLPCSSMPTSQSIPDDASKSMGELERLLEVTEPSSRGSTNQGTTYKLHSGSHLPVAVAGPPVTFYPY